MSQDGATFDFHLCLGVCGAYEGGEGLTAPGRGDMLYMPMGENKPIRVQGAFLTDEEVERIVDFVKNQQEVEYDEAMMPSENTTAAGGSEPEDELFYEVIQL